MVDMKNKKFKTLADLHSHFNKMGIPTYPRYDGKTLGIIGPIGQALVDANLTDEECAPYVLKTVLGNSVKNADTLTAELADKLTNTNTNITCLMAGSARKEHCCTHDGMSGPWDTCVAKPDKPSCPFVYDSPPTIFFRVGYLIGDFACLNGLHGTITGYAFNVDSGLKYYLSCPGENYRRTISWVYCGKNQLVGVKAPFLLGDIIHDPSDYEKLKFRLTGVEIDCSEGRTARLTYSMHSIPGSSRSVSAGVDATCLGKYVLVDSKRC